MSKKSDAALAASFGVRRKTEAIEAGMATSVLSQAAEQVQAPQMLPIESLVDSEYQVRKLDDDHVADLVTSIRGEGLLVPIIVRPLPAKAGENGPQRYEIVSGHHRVKAHRVMELPVVPAVVKQLSDADAAAALTTENMLRKGLSDWEMSKTILKLESLQGISNSQLSRVLGFARSKIAELKAFALLPDGAKKILDEQPKLIGHNLMGDLKALCQSHPELVLEAVTRLADGKLKQAGVLGWIERRVTAEGTKPKADGTKWNRHGIEAEIKYSDKGAKLTGNIDYEKLSRLIEANLEHLRRE